MSKKVNHRILSEDDISRIIELAWEDRTPFEAIESQFGLTNNEMPYFMRKHLKRSAFIRWRTRIHGRRTKHFALRGSSVNRHHASGHRKLHRL